jgi:hypothetical protein
VSHDRPHCPHFISTEIGPGGERFYLLDRDGRWWFSLGVRIWTVIAYYGLPAKIRACDCEKSKPLVCPFGDFIAVWHDNPFSLVRRCVTGHGHRNIQHTSHYTDGVSAFQGNLGSGAAAA